jgi:AAA ATPase domain/Trypsin-like peptidase domain
MRSYRVLVRIPSGLSSQGTGWLIGPRTLCTAFHVVGHCEDRKWMHQDVERATYWVSTDQGEVRLTPIVYDAVGDAALLSCDADLGMPYPLAEQSRIRVPWSAEGFPRFHSGDSFTISGSVVALRSDEYSNRAMQLQVEQGTDVLWEGMSGAPILDENAVTGLITNVTNAVATAWAVPVATLRRLDKLREFIAEATDLLADTPLAPTAKMFAQADEPTIAKSLETLRGEPPDEERVERLQAAFLRVTARAAPPALPPEILSSLRQNYEVLPVREGVRRIRPIAARQFRDIFLNNAHFGGRLTERRKLDAFAAEGSSGYFFVTGTSGYGKTSLLANWIEALRRRGDTVVFHFFSRRMPETLEPEEAFVRLVEQLLAVHDLGGDLPRDDRVRLQSLYADLLQTPAPGGRPLIVVLDALDEVIETIRPGPRLFPQPLGAGVRVVFSARSMAEKKWLAELGLTLPESQTLPLGQMDAEDIEDIVTRAGLKATPSMVATLLEKTKGDPFYVSDVVRVLAEGGVDAVEALPTTHSAYLRAWWDDAIERVQDPGFVDLMGTLAALRAPLAPKELVAVSKEDRLESARIGVLLKNAARYVDDDYWLRHDRIRQFVRDTLGDDMATYQDRVIAFTGRWNDASATDAARAYGRRHAVQHLLEVDRFDEALALVNSEFIAARWREDGSYAPLIANLDAMLEWAQDHPQTKTAMAYVPALAVMRETVRDLMRNLQPELFRAWVRLDKPASLRELIDSLPSHHGEARDPLLAVAEEILEGNPTNESKPADREWAADLLGRVIGLLPLVRTSAWTQEAWTRICRLLAGGSLDSGVVHALLQQGAAFIEQLGADSQDLKAVCLADLAAAAVRTNRSDARRWLDQAEAVAAQLRIGDRAFVAAVAMPAHRRLAVEKLDQEVETLIRAYAADKGDSTFSRRPGEALIEAWAPEPEVVRRVIASGVLELEAGTLLKLGLEKEAWRSLDEAAARNPSQAINLLVRCFKRAPHHRPEIRRRIQSLSLDDDVNPIALAIAGRWPDVLAALDRGGPHLPEQLPACVGRALEDLNGDEREWILDALTKRLDVLSAEDGAEPAATIALHLAKAGHTRARAMLGKAWRSGLGHLPEGDADDLRRVAAVALAADGAIDRATSVALACQWLSQRVAALCTMIPVTGDEAARLRTARQIETVLDKADLNDAGSFVTETLSTICHTAGEIRGRHVDAASALARLVARIIVRQGLQGDWSVISDYVAVGDLVEADTHAELLREVAAMMRTVSDGGGPVKGDRRSLFRDAMYVVEHQIASEELLESLLLRLTQSPEETPQAVGAAAAAWSRKDPARAVTLFQKAIAALPSVAVAEAPSEISLYFRRLIGDLASRPSEAHPMTDPALDVAKSIVAAASRLDRAAVERLLGKLWTCVHDEQLTSTQLGSAVEGLVNIVAGLPSTYADVVERLTPALWSDVDAVRGSLAADVLFLRAVYTLGSRGHLQAAQTAAALIQDQSSREGAEDLVDLFTFQAGVADWSPVERAFLNAAENSGLAVVTLKTIREGQSASARTDLITILRNGRVRHSLMDDALALMPAVHAQWGAKGTEQVVHAIQDVDQRVLDAARRVGAL